MASRQIFTLRVPIALILNCSFASQAAPLGGTVPPQHGFSTQADVEWQRTRRSLDYRLEPVTALTNDHAVISFVKDARHQGVASGCALPIGLTA